MIMAKMTMIVTRTMAPLLHDGDTDSGNMLVVIVSLSDSEFQLSPDLCIHGRMCEQCLKEKQHRAINWGTALSGLSPF